MWWILFTTFSIGLKEETMALFHCYFKSEVLDLSTGMYVIVPERPLSQIRKPRPGKARKYPVLYLLHGMSDDYTIWQRRTSIERYAEALGIAVVMPAVERSFYTDMAHGGQYWTFISEEVPAQARWFFPLSEKRADTYVAGLSMGGYGAFKLALSYPERFAAAASLSGVLDVCEIVQLGLPDWQAEMQNIFGDTACVKDSPNDLFHLAQQVAGSDGPKPRLYQWCGTEDFLHAGNLHFYQLAKRLDLDLTYSEGPGDHTWGYWDVQIEKVLKWIVTECRS
jgi:S-formylglutathione hydrolase FrmB